MDWIANLERSIVLPRHILKNLETKNTPVINSERERRRGKEKSSIGYVHHSMVLGKDERSGYRNYVTASINLSSFLIYNTNTTANIACLYVVEHNPEIVIRAPLNKAHLY
jgi:hypothetical protein